MRERVPLEANRAQPFELGPHHQRQRLTRRQRARQAGLDAARHRGGGRIDSNPAAAFQEHLCPGVGVGLPHGDDLVHGVQLAALVTGDHPCGNTRGAHHEHERRGKVLAKAGLGIEQEFIHRVGAEQRRLERVNVAAIPEESEGARHHFAVRAGRGAQFFRQRDRARVESRRRAQRAPQGGRLFVGVEARRSDHGNEVVAHARAHRGAGEQLAVSGVARSLGQRGCGFQAEQPVAVVRLQHHAVAVPSPAALRRREIDEARRPHRPAAAIEIPHHRTAPVAQRLRRRVAFELGAERDGVGLRELREISRAHAVRQPGQAAVSVLRQAPERALHARKKEEQRHGGGHGVREQQPSGAQVRARRPMRRAEADQRRGDRVQRAAHYDRSEHRLRVQEVGDDEEIAEESRYRGVTVAARLEQLEPREQRQQDDPRLAPEEGAILDPDAEHRHGGDAYHQPAGRQRRAIERAVEAPAEQAQRKHGQPPGRAQRVRRDHDQERADQPGEIARADEAHFGGKRVRRLGHVAW